MRRLESAPHVCSQLDNTVAERFVQTLKPEQIWLRASHGIEEFHAAAETWRRFYNEERPHESIDWQTPSERRAERLTGYPTAAGRSIVQGFHDTSVPTPVGSRAVDH